MRLLPVVLAQSPARDPKTATGELRSEVATLHAEFPQAKAFIYPEYHTCRVSSLPNERRAAYEQVAEPLDGPRVTALCAAAAESGIWLVAGTVIEKGPRGELFNTAVVCSPAGELASYYRKAFPWRPFEPFTPGTGFTVFDIPDIGRAGLAICYDLWFPEVARQLAWMGAEVIVYPTQTSTSDRDQELVLAQAAASANQVFVVSVNAAMPDGVGRSIIADPEGIVRVAAPSEAPAVVTDVLDLDAVTRVRTLGTRGLNRMWSQLRAGDPPLRLPVYGGAIDPATWHPQRRGESDE
jgi:predicted amidohydrolase